MLYPTLIIIISYSLFHLSRLLVEVPLAWRIFWTLQNMEFARARLHPKSISHWTVYCQSPLFFNHPFRPHVRYKNIPGRIYVLATCNQHGRSTPRTVMQGAKLKLPHYCSQQLWKTQYSQHWSKEVEGATSRGFCYFRSILCQNHYLVP